MNNLTNQLYVLSGQIIAGLPNWWQMPVMMGASIAFFGALYAVPKRLRLG